MALLKLTTRALGYLGPISGAARELQLVSDALRQGNADLSILVGMGYVLVSGCQGVRVSG